MADGAGVRAPGWKKDPSGKYAGRYWDGIRWTEHVVTKYRERAVDPVPGDARRTPTPPPLPPTPNPRPAAATAPPPTLTVDTTTPARTRSWRTSHLLVTGVAGLVIGAAIGASTSSGPSPTIATSGGEASTTAALETTKPAAPAGAVGKTYAIGETARTADFEVTVFGFQDPHPPPDQFNRPKAGMHYVSVDVQVANKGSKQQLFSGFIGFHLLDAQNRQYDQSITSVSPRPPEGEIPAGEAIRGLAVFEVPDGTSGLRFRVQGSLSASGAFFALS